MFEYAYLVFEEAYLVFEYAYLVFEEAYLVFEHTQNSNSCALTTVMALHK